MNWNNLRMVGMHPIRGIDQATRYTENTREFPLIIRIWMRMARFAGFLLMLNIVSFSLLITHQIVTLILTYTFLYEFYITVYRTRFDIWTPFGFQVWKWMITVRT